MAQLTDHARAEDLFSAYIDRHVTVDEQVFVERHVAVCAACRAQLQVTRSMVAALRALPAVKAPRSFVLLKSMAVQPKPSIFNWYPALRLATALAAIAFAIVFAGDLLIMRSAGGGNVIMSAAAPAAEATLTLEQAPAAAPPAKSGPADQQSPTSPPAPTRAAPAAGNAARLSPTATREAAALSAQAAPTETLSATDTVETTAVVALAPPAVESTPVPPVAAPAPNLTIEVPPSVDPLSLASLVLGGLVVVLGAVTLIIRRGA